VCDEILKIFCILYDSSFIPHTCLKCICRFKSLFEIFSKLKFTLLRGDFFYQNPYDFFGIPAYFFVSQTVKFGETYI
jgi:hypothetical protein